MKFNKTFDQKAKNSLIYGVICLFLFLIVAGWSLANNDESQGMYLSFTLLFFLPPVLSFFIASLIFYLLARRNSRN
jgi:ABC-type sugar transport system permease subunit